MRALFFVPVVIVALIFLATKFGTGGIIPPKASIDVQERIAYHASQWGLEVALVKAIAKVESNFNPAAKNPSDPSYGLMQITPALAYDYGGLVRDYQSPSDLEIEMIMDINNNLSVACWFLDRLERYSFDQQVQSYNVGETGYKRGYRNYDYLEKVRSYYEQYI
jgi:soluble lytic murein transglycosylase-like protein